ncbi:hypothetical protein D9M69_506970 [compost metagenome]
MRRLRLALIRSGLARSAGVMLLMMPSMRATCFSAWSMLAPCACWANCAGSLSTRLAMPPIFFIWPICALKSSRSKSPVFLIFLASFSAASMSTPRWASSTSAMMSPMPRMRWAMRSGKNGSSPSSFSPTPTNLIGRPVIWRTDSAAPPRASPSSLVSTTPVSGRVSLKALAVLTASWPSMASTTNRVSAGFSSACSAAISCIINSSIPRRPAVSTISTSW